MVKKIQNVYQIELESRRLKSEVFFSICIPAFNASNTIEKCIQSLLNQTFQDFEVIVVDDCSTDKCYGILQTIKDSRFQIYRNNYNRGCLYSRIKAMAKSHGRYILPLDADDSLVPTALEILHTYCEQNPKSTMLQYKIVEEKSNNIARYFNQPYADLSSIDLVRNHFINGLFPHSNKLCHNVIAKVYDRNHISK